MMNDILQIKCPFCGAVLSVKNQAGIATKTVTCPVCKKKNGFLDFIQINYNNPSVSNLPRYENREYTQYADSINYEHTPLTQPNYSIGELTNMENGEKYKLKPGKNIIGRKALKSVADIQIDTMGKRMLSREHILLEIKNVPTKGFVHYLSLFKENVNKTFINNEPLIFGDCMVLNDGDIVMLPDATLKFEIPDSEETLH